jgi:hypothetical protein
LGAPGPRHSSDLALSDFHFFPTLKRTLEWRHFTTKEDAEAAVRTRDTDFYEQEFFSLRYDPVYGRVSNPESRKWWVQFARAQFATSGDHECRSGTSTKFHSSSLKQDQGGDSMSTFSRVIEVEITSTKTIAHLGAIASPHPASIIKTFSRQKGA